MTSTGSSAWRHAIAWIAPFNPPWRTAFQQVRQGAPVVVDRSPHIAGLNGFSSVRDRLYSRDPLTHPMPLNEATLPSGFQ